MQIDADQKNQKKESPNITPNNPINQSNPDVSHRQEGSYPPDNGLDNKRREFSNDSETKAKRVFIGNLSFTTSWQKVKDYMMREVGNVERVHIFTNKDGRSKGCGLVEFTNSVDAERAISQLNHTKLDGRDICVRKDNNNLAKNDRDIRERHMRRSGSRDRDRFYSRSRSHGRDDRRRYLSAYRRSRSRTRSRSPRRDYRYYERSHSRGRSFSRDRRRRSYSRDRDRDLRRRSHSRDRRRSDSRDRYRNYPPSRGYGGRRDDRYRDYHRERTPSRSRSRGRIRPREEYPPKEHFRGFQIIIKNIPWSVTWQQLKDAFREFGPIIRADVPQDETGKSKGYGFIRFERERDAITAIEGMDRALFNGREIEVRMCGDK